jgi:TP901 family phage tail tape measure protein
MARIQLEGILRLIDVDINPAIFQKISRATSTLPNSFKQTSQAVGQTTSNVQGLNTTLGKTNQQLSIGSAFAQKFLQRMAQFAILLPIFATLNRAIQGGVKFMADFESELLNIIRIDPKEAVSRIQEISDAALDIGVRFGVSAIEVIKSVKVFVQAGESISSALDKAKIAAIATQVSTLELAQAQELLIGVQKQFSASALSNIEVLDKISKVEDLTASDAQDMADAFTAGGNALAFATKDFDFAIATIAALREQTRKSGKEIGTFAKTVIPRLFAGGESRTALEQLGVAVENQSGELRPFQNVIEDTAKAFDKLTEAEQVNAAKTIAGVRQFETFLALLKSSNRAAEVYAGSLDSDGTAARKLAVVQEKLSFQVDQTVAEFQKLAVELGNAGVLDFFKDALKAARGFAMGLEEAVKLAKTLGVAIGPLLGVGAFKLGQIAFGGRGGPPPGTKQQGTSSKFNFVGSPNAQGGGPITRGVTGKEFAAFQAASIAAGIALQALTVVFKDSTGTMAQVGESLNGILGAAQTGFQVAALLGPKAGLLVGTFQLVIDALAKITTAIDERKKDLDQIGQDTSHLKASKAIALDAAAGEILTKPILDAMQKALVKSGGVIDDAFFKTISTAIKQVAGNKSLVEQSGLKEADIKNLDLTDVLANPQFIKNLAAANPQFERLNKAIEAGASLSNQQVALYRDLTSAAGSAAIAIQGVVDTLKAVKERDQLRQQEAAINELISQRSQLLRTDVPLFQTEVEQLQERQRALGKFLDVAGAARKDFENLAATNPSELGFHGQSAQASDAAKAFLTQIENAFNSAGKNGDFNLTQVIDNIVKKSRIDTSFGQEDVVPISEAEQSKMTNAAREFVGVLQKGLSEDIERAKVAFELHQANGKEIIELAKVQKSLQEAAKGALDNAELALIKLGVDANLTGEDLINLGNLTTEQFDEIVKSGTGANESLKNLIQTFSGDSLQQAQQSARISSEGFAKELDILDGKIQQVSETISNTQGGVNQETGKTRVQLEEELGQLQIQRISKVKEAEAAGIHDTLALLKAQSEAEKEAAQKAKELAKALDDLAAAQFALKNGVHDAIRSFNEFAEGKLKDEFEKDANAQQTLKSAQQDVLSSTSSLSDTYKAFISSILDFNDALASARIEAGMMGIEMQTLDGGLTGVSARIGALNQVFNSTLKDANISLKERIGLEKQLAQDTLTFLQNAQNEITNAGLEVFGQSPEQNSQLQQGIQGLQFVADKLGGSFEAFSKFNPQQFDQVSQELLSLPTAFRQQILDALRTLPSTTDIGGFSPEQLQNALGQVGAGVNEQVGLPAIADLITQEKEQLTKLQDLAIRDAELQISQVIAAQTAVEDAKIQLEQAKINADRAAEDVLAVREEIFATNDALSMAADQREKLTAELLKATDNETIRQIEAQAREFANQVPLFTDISDKLLDVVTAIGGLQAGVFNSAAAVPTGAKGYIPNFAGGNLSPGEAAGLLRAAAREKRMMPAGAGLAVANTKEAIIPMRHAGFIPNYAEGTASAIASSIQAINGTNAAVVAAITNSITNLINQINTNTANQDIDRQTLDKLDGILSTLQEISVSNTTISDTVTTNTGTTQPAGATAAAAVATPTAINVTVNGKSTVTVTGLENLSSALKEGIRRAQEEQADRTLEPVNSAVEAIFRVLRERNLMSSFGQGQ